MKYYSFNDINAAACCLRFVNEVLPSLGYTVQNNRIQAKWRGGDGFSVAIDEHGYFDHKTKEKGGVITLCALTKFDGTSSWAVQQAQEFLGEWLGIEPKIVPQRIAFDYTKSNRYNELAAKGYKEMKRYVYSNDSGIPCHYTVRMEHPTLGKTFLQCTPFSPSLKEAELHLYNLPSIKASDWAIVVEGEKDADTLIAWGLPATTCNNGADNWRDSYTEELRGKDVVVCRDNDSAGNDHAHLVLRSLASAAKSLRVICPSSLAKGDVTDWRDKEGGDKDKFLAIVKNAHVVSREEALWSNEEYALHQAKIRNREPLANYTTDWKTVKGKDKSVDTPRSINDLIDDIHVRLIGFPKRIGDYTLFDHDRDTGRIEMINSQESLFAWIGQKSGHVVNWKKIDGAVSKGELMAGLMRSATRYEKTSSVPDFPMRSDVYYTFKDQLLPSPEHNAIRSFMDFFNPESEEFAVILAVMLAAPMFYRKGAQRPCWIVDSREGRGVGKTTLVNIIADLYGCHPITTDRNELERNPQELMKRIVSATGRNSRIVLLDNLKGFFDDPKFAEYVTTPNFSGRAPYGHGEDSRVNDLTFTITSNSANIGTDIASRSFMILLRRPKSADGWAGRVTDFISRRRMEVLGDIFHILSSSTTPEDLHTYTRVPDFERFVVFPFCKTKERFNAVMEKMLAERDSANVDSERASDAVEEIKDGLRRSIVNFNPDTGIAFIRSAVISLWLKNLKIDTQDVWNMVNTGQIKCFHKNIKVFPRNKSHRLHGRGLMYIGPNVEVPENPNIPILRLSGGNSVCVVGEEPSPRLMRQLAAEGWFANASSVVEADYETVDDILLPM